MADVIDLVIPNVADYNLRHPRLAFDPDTRDGFLAVGQALADQAVFWSAEPRVLILPRGVDELWWSDVHAALHADPPLMICPVPRSGLLVADLLGDAVALKSLRNSLSEHRLVRFVSYGATEDLYQLAAIVRGLGHDVQLDIPDPGHYWSSLYLDSKQSCLDLATQVPGLRVAPGITVDTWQELRGAVDVILASAECAIVRSRYGVGGTGSAVVSADPGSREQFWRSVRDDQLMRLFPLTVQEYLAHQPGIGCPAVDMLLTEDSGTPGGANRLILSALAVDSHRFVSVNVGAGLLPPALDEEVQALSRLIAAQAGRLGFRGWFGIDFIVDSRGDLYVTEFNARRTGAMHGIALLDRWRGSELVVTHSQDMVPITVTRAVSYQDLRPVFERLWREEVPAFPTAVRALSRRRRSYGLLTGGSDAAHAEGCGASVRHLVGDCLAQPR